ncbi:hypothetical protein SAMN06295912_12137 [Sphingomonas laterariae]|uniref:Uncharacterized protein n=1 Tax=Edaphosphingomonas laterariae TaxID=861865 RepID=A0A239I409_9SPHN|nr:hypothetical protein [Sphingomonas laterariae]SNS88320.1 hypothetical protein SAMN06295912_12137 [Sphingomonas laterariae]
MTPISNIAERSAHIASAIAIAATGDAMSSKMIAAEYADFHWESRFNERALGPYDSLDEEDGELDRVAIIGWLANRWFVATCLVDGNGCPHHVDHLQRFESAWDAEGAFACIH